MVVSFISIKTAAIALYCLIKYYQSCLIYNCMKYNCMKQSIICWTHQIFHVTINPKQSKENILNKIFNSFYRHTMHIKQSNKKTGKK